MRRLRRRLRSCCNRWVSAPRRQSRNGGFRCVFVRALQYVNHHGILATADIDSKRLLAAFDDAEGAAVGSLERRFMTVAANEDVVRGFEIVWDVFWLLAMSRRRDRAETLNIFVNETSEEL